MLHKVEDPLGQTWYVGKGDPAHEAVQKLRAQHYTWIVLPREIIMGTTLGIGTGPGGRISCRRALKAARQMGYNSEGGRRHLRLAECLRLLGG